jgi:inhibitor of the pro-sigma K processing machinery
MKWILRFAGSALIGLAALFLFNFAANTFGLKLGINLFNTVTVGVLGAPGFALLLVLQTLV